MIRNGLLILITDFLDISNARLKTVIYDYAQNEFVIYDQAHKELVINDHPQN